MRPFGGPVLLFEVWDWEGRTALFLIRHGATDWNIQGRMQGHADIPLNDLGWQQAEALARRLAGHQWSALWTSDLVRARSTAERIAAYTGLEPVVWEQLRERSLGALEGKPFAEIREKYPTYLTGEVPMEGVETRRQLQARAMAAVERIAEKHRGGKVLVVTHGAFINALLTVVSNGEMGSGKTRLDNVSVNVFVRDGDRWDAPIVNDVRHLSEAWDAKEAGGGPRSSRV